MGIAHYIKEIGRGKDGARSLSREQAADLMGQVLDGAVSDLEIGGFCLSMRIKGETPDEMAGFLDAAHARLHKINFDCPVVVLPSYNGARKLPVLTPLLAALLAREGATNGFAVLMHGAATEDKRVTSLEVLQSLNLEEKLANVTVKWSYIATNNIANSFQQGSLVYAPTAVLSSGLMRLLDVRRAVGLRNSAHSMVKLMNPVDSDQALIVSSYTHPEYLQSMTATFTLTGARALLLRGTEGESVADARRAPQMDAFAHGVATRLQDAQPGSLAALPDLPKDISAPSTARYIESVLKGEKPVPAPIAQQVEHILLLMQHQMQDM